MRLEVYEIYNKTAAAAAVARLKFRVTPNRIQTWADVVLGGN